MLPNRRRSSERCESVTHGKKGKGKDMSVMGAPNVKMGGLGLGGVFTFSVKRKK